MGRGGELGWFTGLIGSGRDAHPASVKKRKSPLEIGTKYRINLFITNSTLEQVGGRMPPRRVEKFAITLLRGD
jgi:hypothetical protein